jgi:hypothetical protein
VSSIQLSVGGTVVVCRTTSVGSAFPSLSTFQLAVEDTTTRAVEFAAAVAEATLASNAARPAASVACIRARAAADISGGVQSCVL